MIFGRDPRVTGVHARTHARTRRYQSRIDSGAARVDPGWELLAAGNAFYFVMLYVLYTAFKDNKKDPKMIMRLYNLSCVCLAGTSAYGKAHHAPRARPALHPAARVLCGHATTRRPLSHAARPTAQTRPAPPWSAALPAGTAFGAVHPVHVQPRRPRPRLGAARLQSFSTLLCFLF